MEQHTLAKGVGKPGIARSIKLLKRPAIRNEIISRRTRSFIVRQQLESGELTVGNPILVSSGEQGVEPLPEETATGVGLFSRLSRGDKVQRRDAGRGGKWIGVKCPRVFHFRLARSELQVSQDIRSPYYAAS